MRPRVEVVFLTMAQDLIERVIPAIGPSYHQGTVGMIASMLAIVGEEWDRAASRRIEENQRLRELFRQAAPAVNDPALRSRIFQLAKTPDHNFPISALGSHNCPTVS